MAERRWTEEQAEALTCRDHALLAASAGTGKTTTVVGKILWHLGLDVGNRSDGTPIRPCPEPCGLQSIAAITFTEKAAYDLKRKLREELEASEEGRALRWQVDRASLGTIHAFCGELLRDHALRLGIDPTFRVLDERETRLRQDEVLHELLVDRLRAGEPGTVSLVKRFTLYGFAHTDGAIDLVRGAVRDLRWRAPRYRRWREEAGEALDPDALVRLGREAGLWEDGDDPAAGDLEALEDARIIHDLAREAVGRWLDWLERENVRDFDSLVLDVRRLLTRERTRPALRSIRRRYRLLVVDEFQDTDAAQRDIAFAIAGIGERGDDPAREPEEAGRGEPDGADGRAEAETTVGRGPRPQLFLVGDAKQSIYRFRGADISVWNAVEETICGDEEPLQLTHNFRSEPAVVRLVNRVGSRAMAERAAPLREAAPESSVEYRGLEPWRSASRAGGVEWLAVEEGLDSEERREVEGRRVAARVRELVEGKARVVDPESGELRPCRFRDVAVIARTRSALDAAEAALREYEVPAYNTATAGLAGRQEVTDLVTVLRLLRDPSDDLRALAYLRSPFVGLRDEALARIRLDPVTGGGSMLGQAGRWLAAVEAGDAAPFAAPESGAVAEVETDALRRGLAAIREARPLVDRAPHAELLERVLGATGYRLHLLLREGAREATANLERFLALLDEYRHLSLGSFLDLWDRWGEEDLGIPQAPLYSGADDVVTLSTIHGAKGLEWPVVFLVSLEKGPGTSARRLTYSYWSDPDLGPVLMPKKKERGPRSERLFRREVLEDEAEEARLLYVAATRARDRLVLVGPTGEEAGYAGWLRVALEDAVEARDLEDRGEALPGAGEADRPGWAPDPSRAEDVATGTGPQIDAFGFHDEAEDGDGQYSLFAAGPLGGADPPKESAAGAEVTPEAVGPEGDDPGVEGDADAGLRVVVRRSFSSVQTRLPEPPVSLGWLDGIVAGEAPARIHPVELDRRSLVTSATELQMRENDPREWELRYVHGVEPSWRFAPRPADDGGQGEAGAADGGALPPTVRGEVIHGVLERIREEAEMTRILQETLSGIDEADVEELLQPGNRYRHALEREIRRVVRSPEWSWYVSPPHDAARHRELPFVHLVGPREWRVGAFDLYRPAADATPPPSLFEAPPAEEAARDRTPWIVDFKTHEIGPEAVDGTAHEYEVQVRVYREAAEAVLGRGVRVALHFTHPNLAVEA